LVVDHWLELEADGAGGCKLTAEDVVSASVMGAVARVLLDEGEYELRDRVDSLGCESTACPRP